MKILFVLNQLGIGGVQRKTALLEREAKTRI